MKFAGKEISKLSTDELLDAIHSVAIVDYNRVTKISQSRKRHEKLFEKHPPIENETFINLTIALNQEYRNRKNA